MEEEKDEAREEGKQQQLGKKTPMAHVDDGKGKGETPNETWLSYWLQILNIFEAMLFGRHNRDLPNSKIATNTVV